MHAGGQSTEVTPRSRHSKTEGPGEEVEFSTLPPPDILLPRVGLVSGLQTAEIAGNAGGQGRGCSQTANAEALATVPCGIVVDALQAGPYSVRDSAVTVSDAVPGVSDREDLVAAPLEPGE
eukprot:1686804-Rhodomonas_salina.1